MVGENSVIAPVVVMDEAEALALVGASATERFTVGGATVVIGPAGILIITDAADTPDKSGVWNAQEVRLLGPAPAPVMERLLGQTGTWSSRDTPLPIHLMVRVVEGLVYLGAGRVVQAETMRRPGCAADELIRCTMRLDPTLSKSLLERVRQPGPPVGLPGLEWLRHVNGDRATALEQFVTGWYPATAGTSDPACEGVPSAALPEGLKQLYRLAEHRPGVLGVQNYIVKDPGRATDSYGDMRVFGVENQGCFFWSLLWSLGEPEDDPTVWYREDDEPPIAELEPLSGFLIQFSLFEASMGADYKALSREISGEQVQQLTEGLRVVPLRPFWAGTSTRFYVGPGLVMHVSNGWEDNQFTAWAGATHRSALAPLSHMDIDWLRYDG
ncbi:hypothetical protein OH779_20405 [Actinacidiphila glaucinigra]|uniref:hypothetical protein n=1 Tax=Actinacidiphila glaucinigra TaxID=235986 RepID=UPI0038667811